MRQGCGLLVNATLRLLAPVVILTILGAVLGNKLWAILGATVGIIIGLALAARLLLATPPAPTDGAKPTPPTPTI